MFLNIGLLRSSQLEVYAMSLVHFKVWSSNLVIKEKKYFFIKQTRMMLMNTENQWENNGYSSKFSSLTCVPTVMLGIDEMPALDFGFLFFALAFSSIFLRWLKGTTPLQIEGQNNKCFHTFRSHYQQTRKIIKPWGTVSNDFHAPPVKAVLQLSTRVESAALQWYQTFSLEFRESLSTVLQLGGHGAQCVIHPGGHLHNAQRTLFNANN